MEPADARGSATVQPLSGAAEGGSAREPVAFMARLRARWQGGTLLCVGLDPEPERLPEPLRALPVEEALVAFNRAIVVATRDLVCAYKPNAAFYEAHGLAGQRALARRVGAARLSGRCRAGAPSDRPADRRRIRHLRLRCLSRGRGRGSRRTS